MDSGTTVATFTGHAGAVMSVAFSPDGTTLATGSKDDTAKLWRIP
ncbi:WD40 repeat domain-containing protein [Streptosporangium lutulentum]